MGESGKKVAVRWTDGTVDEGAGWVDVENVVRRRQWHSYDNDAWRGEMRERVVVLVGHDVPELETATSERFFEILEGLGLLTRVVEESTT